MSIHSDLCPNLEQLFITLSDPLENSRFKYKNHISVFISNTQYSSITQSCPTLCDAMDCSMPRFPVHHQLPEITQTHTH